MVVPSSLKGLWTEALSLKYAPSGGIPNILMGDIGSKIQSAMSYVWWLFVSSVSTRRSVSTSFVLTLVPSAVSSVIFVGMRLFLKTFLVEAGKSPFYLMN